MTSTKVVSEYFKKSYKKTLIFFFKLIYKLPKYIKKIKKDLIVKKIKLGNSVYRIYKLKEGRVFTNSVDVCAYITKSNYITNASYQFKKYDHINSFNQSLKFNKCLKEGTPRVKKKIKGNVLSLLSGGASNDNFTHWFTDTLPKLAIFKTAYNINKIDKFLVPNYQYNFQRESLEMLGIYKYKVLSSKTNKHITADCIYATSHPCFYKPTLVKNWSIKYLKKVFLKNVKKNKIYNKIFIDRDQYKLIANKNFKDFKEYRILLNESEIKDFLKKKGFKIIKPEDYSFKDQLNIFFSAKEIVSLYGAAMMMITFCSPKTKIIEIRPLRAGLEFEKIAKLNNLDHKVIKIKPLYDSLIPQNGLLYCGVNELKKKLS